MTELKHVTILTQYYPPETGAPQARLHEMARHLLSEGLTVSVLTAMPNYPLGRVFDGYRNRFFAREVIDGVEILRVPIIASNASRALPRLISYFSFVITSFIWGMIMMRRSDVLIYESPPLFLGLSAVPLSWRMRAKLVMNVSDLWPESIVRLGALHDGKMLEIFKWLERFLYRRADLITGQSPGIVRAIKQEAPTENIALFSNGCDCDTFMPTRANRRQIDALGWGDKVVIGYAGLIGMAQGIGLFLDVATRLRGHDNIRFLLAGDGPELRSLRAKAQDAGLTNIHFLGPLAKPEMPGLVASFDIALVPLRRFIPGALPSKLYELMASACPIILAAEGDPADLIRSANAGVIVDYDNASYVADQILALANSPERRGEMGENGRNYVVDHHDRKTLADGLLVTLRELVDDHE